MRISDWSSDVCSSDLRRRDRSHRARGRQILSGDQDRIHLTSGRARMKPQAAPLVTGYALACVVIHVLLWITGFQFDAILRAGFIPARFGSELILPPGTLMPFVLTPLSSALLPGGVLRSAAHT